ncbi:MULTISPECIES: hypothetical protein [unclassified Streptomyces]|uniref:hypothetical protein n=1 Tax=unclassified Streptomyces TaxID=2593676 RepID=UPI00224E1B4C|nr:MULTISPECIES: hypothetical protein [unclassified Streptomyces]MCX4989243.1 hypothetical protein [Streptomyces sp. NBC_00568]MCX5005536.1 hypothetical protein [Streptomyces sp. NBC_00638]
MTSPLSQDLAQPPPSDYQLLLPDAWFRVALEPERRRQSVDALVNRQFDGVDNEPRLRRLLRQELLERATNAFDQGGIELYISLQRAGSLTIPASLLITLIPPRNPGAELPSLRELADELEAEGRQGRTVSMSELAAGMAMRVRVDPDAPAVHPTDPTTSGEADIDALPSMTVDYQLGVPRSDMYLLLTFSTPLVQIADAMVDLFDAVAGSLSWKDG